MGIPEGAPGATEPAYSESRSSILFAWALVRPDRIRSSAAITRSRPMPSRARRIALRAAELFTCVQSLDRPSLAEALEKAARARGLRLDVLLEVNTGDEETKSGTSAEGAVALAARMPEWPSLRLRGLMAIPPWSEDPEATRPYFVRLRELRDRLSRESGTALRELSMGMSNDFEAAIEEGATMVRVGTAIFGSRQERG